MVSASGGWTTTSVHSLLQGPGAEGIYSQRTNSHAPIVIASVGVCAALYKERGGESMAVDSP